MHLLPRELPTGRWGEQFEPGVVDGILEAAVTANDCVQAYAAANLAEHTGSQHISNADLADERAPTATGVRRDSASNRYGAVTDYADALLREWARQALHLARVASAVRVRLDAEPSARIGLAELQLADVANISTVFANPALLTAPPGADGTALRDQPVDPHAAHRRILEVVADARLRRTSPELFDRALPDDYDIASLGLYELAGALHDYGAWTLWELALLTE